MIHAIGDLAVRTALDAFGSVGTSRLADLALMPRIEHAQLVHPDDRHRFAQLGVAASVQPVQLRSDEATMRRAWGPRTSLAFPLASLADGGVAIAFGSDAPIEPPEPWPGIAMAITRWAPEWDTGTPASSPQEALTLDRAIRAAIVGPRTPPASRAAADSWSERRRTWSSWPSTIMEGQVVPPRRCVRPSHC